MTTQVIDIFKKKKLESIFQKNIRFIIIYLAGNHNKLNGSYISNANAKRTIFDWLHPQNLNVIFSSYPLIFEDIFVLWIHVQGYAFGCAIMQLEPQPIKYPKSWQNNNNNKSVCLNPTSAKEFFGPCL